ncbi:glycosyltransferase family 1 protein [Paenibacillus sambharensis]|uniref:Glycosyltransferase family 1 protein n=1 Tax=Paenibacillus sambharensis TaxID=1803190 RepID=A0A2W1LJE2_9BACL|nr:glycosyltransferase family 4 protein [Paenibacillus sambharensis]PZD95122.1 glycosyltransferase family 1 protein [Paenibacillus sambharensis]
MAPSKAAFITPGSFVIPSPSGSSVERVVEHIVPLLDRSRVEPRIYGRSSRRLKRIGSVRGVRCERFPAVDKALYVRKVGRAAARFGPRLIQVENRPAYALRLKRLLPRCAVWLNLHSSTFIGSRYISREKLNRCLAAVDRIIVNSHYLLGLVAAMAPQHAHKLRVIHLGVDTNRFMSRFTPEGMERRAALRAARGWDGRKVVLFVGRLIPRKGVHHLLRIVPKLAAAHPDVLVVIVGSPYYGSHRMTTYARRLRQLAEAAKGHVRFVPYVSYAEVPDWFIAADVACVPSGADEAFGLVNVEAMAAGLPVVASRAGGMPEIVEDGVTGYLVGPEQLAEGLYDRLSLLLSNAELRSFMGSMSRQRVEQYFNWQRAANQWIELLKEFEEQQEIHHRSLLTR